MTSLSPWLPGVCTDSRGDRLTDTGPPLPPAQRAATLSSTSHFVVGHRDGESDFIPSFLLASFLSLFSFIYSPFLSFFSRFCFLLLGVFFFPPLSFLPSFSHFCCCCFVCFCLLCFLWLVCCCCCCCCCCSCSCCFFVFCRSILFPCCGCSQ